MHAGKAHVFFHLLYMPAYACTRTYACERIIVTGEDTRAVRYHLKFAYHDTIVRVSRYTLGTDTSHDMAYMR